MITDLVFEVEQLRGWAISSYNEDTPEQLDYYMNECKCEVGDKAYLYSHGDNELVGMTIVHVISMSSDMENYNNLLNCEDVLLNGEDMYGADTSAEFITDNDCYLVWFKYV